MYHPNLTKLMGKSKAKIIITFVPDLITMNVVIII